jgi:spore coat protein U-like protein
MSRSRRFLLALVVLLAAPVAHAAVTCTATATTVAFGTYNPMSATAATSTGSISVRCTATGSPETVSLVVSLSTGLSGTYTPRRMFSGANPMDYNLFFSTAYTQIWGDGTAGTFRGTASITPRPGNPATATGTIYGRVPALQNVAAGSYLDSIVMTVTY